MTSVHTYFLAGHAKLPQGMAAKSVFDTLTITAEIDKKYGVIIEASCTLATDHGKEFVGQLLKGVSLKDGIDEPINTLQTYYLGRASNALAAALKDLYTQFEHFSNNNSQIK